MSDQAVKERSSEISRNLQRTAQLHGNRIRMEAKTNEDIRCEFQALRQARLRRACPNRKSRFGSALDDQSRLYFDTTTSNVVCLRDNEAGRRATLGGVTRQ